MLNTTICGPRAALALLDDMYRMKMPVFLWGRPGIGKSRVVRHFATQHGIRMIDLRLTTLESVDLRGLPWIDSNSRQTVWMRPEFFPVEDEPAIIFLDELTAAEPRIQASSYQLILDRAIGSHVLPPSVWVIGAGNGLDDGSISYGMGEALADRFLHVNLVANAQDWLSWALESNIHPAVITFIRVKPECLEGFQTPDASDHLVRPSPRSWERVSDVLKQVERKQLHNLVVSGLVGESVAAQFFHVVEEMSGLPNMAKLIVMKPRQAAKRVPATLPSLYGFAYSAVAFVQELPQMEWLVETLSEMSEIADGNPRAEIQALGMELLLEKASRLKQFDALIESAAYRTVYAEKAVQLAG